MVLMGMSTVGVVSGGVVSAPADVAPAGVIMVFAAQYTSLALKITSASVTLHRYF